MTEYTIKLPLPPRECSANARVHWGTKARAIRLYREACAYLIKQATQRKQAISGQVTIDLDFYLCKGIQAEGLYLGRDPDNCLASAKAAIDALATAGVIKGDTKKYVRIGEVRLFTRRDEHHGRSELVMHLSSTNGTGEN